MTDGTVAWWIAAAFLAFFVKGLSGFANTLVFNSILSFTADNIRISPIELVLGYPSNIILAVKERKKIRLSIVAPLAAMVVAGNLAGVFLLKNLDARIVRIIFGAVVVLVGAEMLTRRQDAVRKEPSRAGMFVSGIISGIVCGLYGVGALLGAYVSRHVSNSGAFKGNLCAVFVVENTFRIILYLATGILTLPLIKSAMTLMPVMLAGLLCGMLCGKKIGEARVKNIIILLLILSGVILILTNI